MSAFRGRSHTLIQDMQALAIVLTASLLEWLRELPTRRTLHMLKLIAELHRKHNENVWPARLQAMAAGLRLAHDSNQADRLLDALQEILGAFGHPGSLTDVYLSPQNGHKIKPQEVEAVNVRLGALRTQLYLSARQSIARVRWNQARAGRLGIIS